MTKTSLIDLTAFSRRTLVIGGARALTTSRASSAIRIGGRENAIDPTLLQRALRSYERHRTRLTARDYIGIADFSVPSRAPRFHLLDMMSGKSQSLSVAHGRGSDPDHSRWVERFSNLPGLAASSQGAYLTRGIYQEKHSRSRRLVGLNPDNSNAEARAIVIHAA